MAARIYESQAVQEDTMAEISTDSTLSEDTAGDMPELWYAKFIGFGDHIVGAAEIEGLVYPMGVAVKVTKNVVDRLRGYLAYNFEFGLYEDELDVAEPQPIEELPVQEVVEQPYQPVYW